MGRWIGAKLNACNGPVRFLIPEGGVSMIDAPGQPFYDPEADAALFAAIESAVQATRIGSSSGSHIISTIALSPRRRYRASAR